MPLGGRRFSRISAETRASFCTLPWTYDCSALPIFYGTMASADFSQFVVAAHFFHTSVRSPRAKTKSFPSSTCRIYECWFRVAIGLYLELEVCPQHPPYIRFLFVRPRVCLSLPSDPALRQAPLRFSHTLPTTGHARDFHPLESAHAGRTNDKTS